MADLEKAKVDKPPESLSTARELEFDDDPPTSPQPTKSTAEPETHNTLNPTTTAQEAPPPQPPRPLSPRQQAENTLKEAFPGIEAVVIRAVLTASGGQLEPAFNALLEMSDPSAVQEPVPPPQPPRPVQSPRPQGTGRAAQIQLEADELYARQLAEHYNGPAGYKTDQRSASYGSRGQEPRIARPKKDTALKPNELYDDREHSFLDDDLPVIRDNIRKGFLETQSKVNSFIANLKKRIDGDEEEDFSNQAGHAATGYRVNSPQPNYSDRRSADMGRRSGDRERYDADPQVLGDDFAGLNMRDDTTPRRSRPLANPDLFKPTAQSAAPGGRRVSFQDGPPEEIADFRGGPDPTNRPVSSASKSKWQPLAAVDPHPISDHDPFSLGDSDEDEAKKKDIKVEDTERLKQAAAEAMSDDIGSNDKKVLQASEKVGVAGTRDKEAEDKLTGKS